MLRRPIETTRLTRQVARAIATRGDIVRKQYDKRRWDRIGEPYCIRSSMFVNAALSFRAFLISWQLT